MRRLKEFLYLAAFRLDVPFEPGSHLTDLRQPRKWIGAFGAKITV